MNPLIFREYDIRGIVGEDLTEDTVYTLGRAFGTYAQIKGKRVLNVGHDNRLSSEGFRDALVKGLVRTGCDVWDLGLIPTPLLYFSLHHLKDSEGGVMITGSHNPPDFNGFKMNIGTDTIYGEQIQELRRLIESGGFKDGSKGIVRAYDIIPHYKSMIKDKINIRKPLNVVVDAGNGTSSIVAPDLIEELGCNVKRLYCESDGRFPNHHPDPTVEAYIQELINTVRDGDFDCGLAYDGDGDRIGVVDETGNILWGDQLLILFSRYILSERKGATIIFDVKCSQNLEKDVKAHGGRPVMWRTGHSLIKNKMKEENAALAGEMSGHIFFADRYYGYDDAIYVSCRLLEILSMSGIPLGKILSDVPKTYTTPEIRIECPDEDKFRVVEEIKRRFKKDHEVISIDGARILFERGWGLVRASNTQPVLVLRFEAYDKESLENIKDEVMDALKGFSSVKLPKVIK
ncbi:phosphomannomutase/phosphoglucomutase [bacterium]|nr:phosphomannomutase/phosphoglucomutase [bacterium]